MTPGLRPTTAIAAKSAAIAASKGPGEAKQAASQRKIAAKSGYFQQPARSTRDGDLRPPATWLVSLISSGEKSLSQKLEEDGGEVLAGQETRIISVPLKENAYGIHEKIPAKFNSPAEFSQYLKEESRKCYGVACRPFLVNLCRHYDQYVEKIQRDVAEFVKVHCPSQVDGQVSRVATKMALIAVAGEIAIEMGILPWEKGEALRCVVDCFIDWKASRGGNGSMESIKAEQKVLEKLQRFEIKHFDIWHQGSSPMEGTEDKSLDRWGYRTIREGQTEFWVSTSGFDRLCEGMDKPTVTKALKQSGILKSSGDKSAKLVKIYNQPRARYYHLAPGSVNIIDQNVDAQSESEA